MRITVFNRRYSRKNRFCISMSRINHYHINPDFYKIFDSFLIHFRTNCGTDQQFFFLNFRYFHYLVFNSKIAVYDTNPPKRASAIARALSVTVSIGDETKGIESLIFFVRCVSRRISCLLKSLYPGRRRRSSNVNPSINFEELLLSIFNCNRLVIKINRRINIK